MPRLSRENEYSISLWNRFAAHQLRVDFGVVHGLELGAIATVFASIGIEDIEWQLGKMIIIFEALYGTGERV